MLPVCFLLIFLYAFCLQRVNGPPQVVIVKAVEVGSVNSGCVTVEDHLGSRPNIGTEMYRALENQEFPGGKFNIYRL